MSGKHVVVVGAGGVIGSHLVPHLARMPQVVWVTLVDGGIYEEKNLLSQDISPRDVGQPKACVQAERLRRLNPELVRVDAAPAWVEEVPLGVLRGDVILAGLDSRRARLAVNQIAWRLGAPWWIDAGVLGSALLVRVNVYLPGPDGPCIECAWSPADYAAVEQEYPCGPAGGTAYATHASSALGALAASMQALECQKLLAGAIDTAAVGRQVTIDARWHRLTVTTFRRNQCCLFDHQTWRIEPLPCRLEATTVEQVLQIGGCLRVEGQTFVRKLVCPDCGAAKALFRLSASLRRPDRACPYCGRSMAAPGFDVLECLAASLSESDRACTLADVGFRIGDVVSIGERHFELIPSV